MRPPDFPDLQVADPGRLPFLDQPAHVGKLRIGDVVAAAAQGTDCHPTQTDASQRDPDLVERDFDFQFCRALRQQAVVHRQALENLSRNIGFRKSCPIDIYTLLPPVQLHADKRFIRAILNAHYVQVGVHQTGIVSAQEDRGPGGSVGNVDIGRQDELRQEIGVEHALGGADPFRVGERVVGSGFRSAGQGRQAEDAEEEGRTFHGVVTFCGAVS